jgi:hypothetical protein
MQAWDIPADMVVDAPKWIATDRYDITAKAPAGWSRQRSRSISKMFGPCCAKVSAERKENIGFRRFALLSLITLAVNFGRWRDFGYTAPSDQIDSLEAPTARLATADNSGPVVL